MQAEFLAPSGQVVSLSTDHPKATDRDAWGAPLPVLIVGSSGAQTWGELSEEGRTRAFYLVPVTPGEVARKLLSGWHVFYLRHDGAASLAHVSTLNPSAEWLAAEARQYDDVPV